MDPGLIEDKQRQLETAAKTLEAVLAANDPSRAADVISESKAILALDNMVDQGNWQERVEQKRNIAIYDNSQQGPLGRLADGIALRWNQLAEATDVLGWTEDLGARTSLRNAYILAINELTPESGTQMLLPENGKAEFRARLLTAKNSAEVFDIAHEYLASVSDEERSRLYFQTDSFTKGKTVPALNIDDARANWEGVRELQGAPSTFGRYSRTGKADYGDLLVFTAELLRRQHDWDASKNLLAGVLSEEMKAAVDTFSKEELREIAEDALAQARRQGMFEEARDAIEARREENIVIINKRLGDAPRAMNVEVAVDLSTETQILNLMSSTANEAVTHAILERIDPDTLKPHSAQARAYHMLRNHYGVNKPWLALTDEGISQMNHGILVIGAIVATGGAIMAAVRPLALSALSEPIAMGAGVIGRGVTAIGGRKAGITGALVGEAGLTFAADAAIDGIIFEVTDSVLRTPVSGSDAWNNFASRLAHSVGMFGAIKGGKFVWNKFGSDLMAIKYGTHAATKMRSGQTAELSSDAWLMNELGNLSTEVTAFTTYGMSVEEVRSIVNGQNLGESFWERFVEHQGANLKMIMELRLGGKLFGPMLQRAVLATGERGQQLWQRVEKIYGKKVVADASLELPKNTVNEGFGSSSFPEPKNDAQIQLVERYRGFSEDYHRFVGANYAFADTQSAQYQALKPIFDKVQNAAGFDDLELVVVKDYSVNMFHIPFSNRIYVNEGIVSSLADYMRSQGKELTEGHLASILGHEIVHREQSHFDAAEEKSTFESVTKAHSKQKEYHADERGMRLAALAGYNPTEMLDVTGFLAKNNSGVLAIVSTHPHGADRHKRLTSIVADPELFLQGAELPAVPYREGGAPPGQLSKPERGRIRHGYVGELQAHYTVNVVRSTNIQGENEALSKEASLLISKSGLARLHPRLGVAGLDVLTELHYRSQDLEKGNFSLPELKDAEVAHLFHSILATPLAEGIQFREWNDTLDGAPLEQHSWNSYKGEELIPDWTSYREAVKARQQGIFEAVGGELVNRGLISSDEFLQAADSYFRYQSNNAAEFAYSREGLIDVSRQYYDNPELFSRAVDPMPLVRRELAKLSPREALKAISRFEHLPIDKAKELIDEVVARDDVQGIDLAARVNLADSLREAPAETNNYYLDRVTRDVQLDRQEARELFESAILPRLDASLAPTSAYSHMMVTGHRQSYSKVVDRYIEMSGIAELGPKATVEFIASQEGSVILSNVQAMTLLHPHMDAEPDLGPVIKYFTNANPKDIPGTNYNVSQFAFIRYQQQHPQEDGNIYYFTSDRLLSPHTNVYSTIKDGDMDGVLTRLESWDGTPPEEKADVTSFAAVGASSKGEEKAFRFREDDLTADRLPVLLSGITGEPLRRLLSDIGIRELDPVIARMLDSGQARWVEGVITDTPQGENRSLSFDLERGSVAEYDVKKAGYSDLSVIREINFIDPKQALFVTATRNDRVDTLDELRSIVARYSRMSAKGEVLDSEIEKRFVELTSEVSGVPFGRLPAKVSFSDSYHVYSISHQDVVENLDGEGLRTLKAAAIEVSAIASPALRVKIQRLIHLAEARVSPETFTDTEVFRGFVAAHMPDYSLYRDAVIDDVINSNSVTPDQMRELRALNSSNTVAGEAPEVRNAALRSVLQVASSKLSAPEKSGFVKFIVTGDDKYLPKPMKSMGASNQIRFDELPQLFHSSHPKERRELLELIMLGENGVLNDKVALSVSEQKDVENIAGEIKAIVKSDWDPSNNLHFYESAYHGRDPSGRYTSPSGDLERRVITKDEWDTDFGHHIRPKGDFFKGKNENDHLRMYSPLTRAEFKVRMREIFNDEYATPEAEIEKAKETAVQAFVELGLGSETAARFGNSLRTSVSESLSPIEVRGQLGRMEFNDRMKILGFEEGSREREVAEEFWDTLHAAYRPGAEQQAAQLRELVDADETVKRYQEFADETVSAIDAELQGLGTSQAELATMLALSSQYTWSLNTGPDDTQNRVAISNVTLGKISKKIGEHTAFNSLVYGLGDIFLGDAPQKERVIVEDALSVALETYSPYRRLYLLDSLIKTVHDKEDAGTPEKIVAIFEASGPVGIKFGQILADRPDIITDPAIRTALQVLKSSGVGMSKTVHFDTAESQGIELAEVGGALGLASIKQVNKGSVLVDGAILEGRAVKTVRPTLAVDLREDVAVAHALADHFQGRAPGLVPIVTEVAKEISREADLRREAYNQARLHENIDGKRFHGYTVRVPVADAATQSVMVEPIAHGVPLRNLEDAGPVPAELDRAVVASFFSQVINDGFFHADMHSKNVFVHRGNTRADGLGSPTKSIELIDVGMVGSLDFKQRMAYLKFFEALQSGDAQGAQVFTRSELPEGEILTSTTQARLDEVSADPNLTLGEKVGEYVMELEGKVSSEFIIFLKGLASISPSIDRIAETDNNTSNIAAAVTARWLATSPFSSVVAEMGKEKGGFKGVALSYASAALPKLTLEQMALVNGDSRVLEPVE